MKTSNLIDLADWIAREWGLTVPFTWTAAPGRFQTSTDNGAIELKFALVKDNGNSEAYLQVYIMERGPSGRFTKPVGRYQMSENDYEFDFVKVFSLKSYLFEFCSEYVRSEEQLPSVGFIAHHGEVSQEYAQYYYEAFRDNNTIRDYGVWGRYTLKQGAGLPVVKYPLVKGFQP